MWELGVLCLWAWSGTQYGHWDDMLVGMAGGCGTVGVASVGTGIGGEGVGHCSHGIGGLDPGHKNQSQVHIKFR